MKMLATKNSKLKNMLIYSHSPVKGCMDCESCAKSCYALKAYRQYKQSRVAWDRHLDLAKNDLETFKNNLRKQMKSSKLRTVRIHSSGDFISQDYVNAWTQIIKEHPEHKFYTYSKSEYRFDFSEMKSLPNMNLISSFIDGKLNFGNKEHIQDLVENHGAFLCPATVDKSVKCGLNCDYCVTNDRVCFNQH